MFYVLQFVSYLQEEYILKMILMIVEKENIICMLKIDARNYAFEIMKCDVTNRSFLYGVIFI